MNKKRNKIATCILIGFVILQTSGCAIYHKKLNPWVGRTSDQLLRSWGPPDSTVKLENGNVIVQYVENYQHTPSMTMAYGNTENPPERKTTWKRCTTRFEVDGKTKQVVRWWFHGDCEPWDRL